MGKFMNNSMLEFLVPSTWHASISESCLVISYESGRSRHTKNRSDLSKKALWLCLQMIQRFINRLHQHNENKGKRESAKFHIEWKCKQ